MGRFPCPGHGDGACSGEVPILRSPAGYEHVGPCSTWHRRQVVDRTQVAFGLSAPQVRDEIFRALGVPPRRLAEGDRDPRGRVNDRAFDALASMPERRGVWLSGNVGSGKSFLAWHAVARLIRDHGQRWVCVTEGMLREAWRVYTATDGEDPWARRVLRQLGWPCPDGLVDGILLDELGSLRGPSDAANDLLDGIVHTAHAAGCSFIVTTNRSGRDLPAERGERAVSRLLDVCGTPILLRGDWRVAREAG